MQNVDLSANRGKVPVNMTDIDSIAVAVPAEDA